jgi:hypothetical protein
MALEGEDENNGLHLAIECFQYDIIDFLLEN